MSAAPAETEEGFLKAVEQLAYLCGWRVYHTRNSRRSAHGWPDLELCRPPRFVVAELKSATGRLSKYQAEWLKALGCCPGIETYLWRPADWADIERILRR